MELKIGICDDNKFYCKILYDKLKKIDNLKESEINSFYTSSDFLASIKATNYDLVFMDIDLDNHNSGLDLALELKSLQPRCLIIFVSSFDNYYMDMKKVDPFYYFHKPVDDKELLIGVERALQRLRLIKTQFTYVYISNGVERKFNLHDVLYFKSVQRMIIGHLKDHSSIEFYEKLDDLEKNIAEIYPYFLRANKRYLVNYHYCLDKQKRFVHVDKHKIKITRKYAEEFKKKFMFISKIF